MLEYQRDVPVDSSEEVIDREMEHVQQHLASIADADDDPTTHAADVRVWLARHPSDPTMLRIEGALDAERKAEYDREDFEPFAGIDPALMRAAGLLDG